MITNLSNLAAQQLAQSGKSSGLGASPTEGGTSFADVLKQQIGEVAQMQQDASSAVKDLATGKTDDVTGVFVAMEKSETAFQTLLAIRSKLLDAYDEIKNMPI